MVNYDNRIHLLIVKLFTFYNDKDWLIMKAYVSTYLDSEIYDNS